MADLFHWIGQDLSVSASGDLLTVDGTVKGQQLVIRRLLTVIQSYIFETTYGAGLASYIGTPTALKSIAGVVKSQLYLERAVSQSPPPTVTVTPIVGGLNVVINYVDAQTGAPAVLNFNVKE